MQWQPKCNEKRNALGLEQKSTIPEYPQFKVVSFSDKYSFEQFVHEYETYSDFNFNSFFSWDTTEVHELSQLNGNLVLKFADYITSEPFYSLIGTTEVDDTILELLERSEKNGFYPILKLVSEVTVNAIKNSADFSIVADPNNHDYIFSITELSELKGHRFHSKRRAAKKCAATNKVTISDESKNVIVETSIIEVLNKWEICKRQSGKDVDMGHELIAVKRILKNLTSQETLYVTVAKHEDEIVGFSIDELLPNKFVLSHYFKTLPGINGLAEYLNMTVARKFRELGYEHWSWEQDLGISSLKTMKLGYRPVSMQRKYIIQKGIG